MVKHSSSNKKGFRFNTHEGITIAGLLQEARQRLSKAGVEAADATARSLLAHVLRWAPAQLAAEVRQPVSRNQARRFVKLVHKREQGQPLQYLTGEEEFMGLRLRVGRGVLIPRPETELLAQAALAWVRTNGALRAADLGTGSGCLALALARAVPLLRVVGVDRSSRALRWARRNRRRYAVRNLRLLQGNLAGPWARRWQGRFDLVVANPPYIPRADLSGLQTEVQREPRLALDGGADGLACIRLAAATAARWLRPGGWFGCEIGAGQAAAAERIFTDAKFSDLQVLSDWQDLPRVVTGLRSAD